jgi:alpha-tubulin suppressor-like RCC1 family protein
VFSSRLVFSAICGLISIGTTTSCRSNSSSSTSGSANVASTKSTEDAVSDAPETKPSQGTGRPGKGKPVAIAAGWTHACLHTDTDDLYCWGMNSGGEVGDGTINEGSPFENVRSTPFHLGKLEKIKDLALGTMISLGLGGDGSVWVWGSRVHLEPLRDGNYKSRLRPEKLGVGIRLESISTSGNHVCGIDARGDVYCWGANDYGELGDGTNEARPIPKKVNLPELATYVSVSGNHSCVVVKSGAVYCWGLDPRGRPLESPDEHPDGPHFKPHAPDPLPLANARVLPGPPPHPHMGPQPRMHADSRPIKIEELPPTKSIALGEATLTMPYACALGMDSIVRCWGANDRGQLADSTYIDRSTPKPIKNIEDATAIYAAGSRACVIRRDKSLWCWGLRYGISPVSPIPVQEPLTDVHDMALGTDFACAIHGDGIVSCWGDNHYSQLGNGSREPSEKPVRVAFTSP